ncbi:CoA transferase [Jatrophihabitans sp.]|uniref:CaiB/BaiF CoA-transferase family protein n=1 Tax=Jatrophihabitans sp. TaxID=1932789 RepID=UPI0030C6E622|nr:acyl-CoA transferase [Jatrophihabitans sp.]
MTAPIPGGPLQALRVIDTTSGIAGPVATMLLADLGADVIRAEFATVDAAELPGSVMWSRGKTIVPVEVATALSATADLVVTSDAGVAGELGLTIDAPLSQPQVHLHLPTWRPGNAADALTMDRMMQAEYGIARRQTSFSGAPVDCVYPFASYLQGAWGATCGIAALVELARSGVGQSVVVDALHGAIVAATTTMFTDPLLPLPSTTVGPGGPNPAFGPYQCADGRWLFLGALGAKFQDIAFGLLGTMDILDEPRIRASREEIYAVDLRDGVRARIAEGFRRKGRDEWLAEFAAAGCPSSPVNDRDDWLDHAQVAALGQRVELDDPLVGPVVMGGHPLRFSGHSLAHRPRRFADTAAWDERRAGADSIRAVRQSPVTGAAGPLAGHRVLDLGTVLAGPYAGQLLAALGADVIKVETPRGDEFRLRGHMLHRGQRGLSIDLRDPRGHAAFLALVGASDVVLDNFRPGVLTRLGLDLDSLRAVKPDIVTMSITGYGGVGPLGDLPGYDPVVQALTGIMQAQGGDAEPVFCTVAVNDVTVACLAALGTVAALYRRAVSGQGQAVNSSLIESSTFMQSGELVRFAGRPSAELGGRDYPGPTPLSRYYRCADGWVRIQLPSAQAAVDTGLIDPDRAEPDDLAEALAAAFAELPSSAIRARLEPFGGTVARGRDNKELLLDPTTIADGHIGKVVWPDGAETYLPRSYVRFGRYGQPSMMVACGKGQHSRQILREAGLDAALIDQLVEDGIVVQGEAMQSVAGTGYR